MTDYRQQAIQDVDETLEGIQDKYVPARLRPMYRYAVAQREARLRLEEDMKLIEHKADQMLQGQYTVKILGGLILGTARAALNPVKEGE